MAGADHIVNCSRSEKQSWMSHFAIITEGVFICHDPAAALFPLLAMWSHTDYFFLEIFVKHSPPYTLYFAVTRHASIREKEKNPSGNEELGHGSFSPPTRSFGGWGI